jgi:hypothetical protein
MTVLPRTSAPAATGAAVAIYTAGGLFWAFLPFFLGLQADKIGLAAYQAGLLGSAYLLGFTLASISALWWASRFDWRGCVGLAVAVILVCLRELSVGRAFAAVAGACGAMGLSMGALWVVAYRIFGASPNPDRIFGLAIAISYSALAAITFLIGRWVIPTGGLPGLMAAMAGLVVILGSGVIVLPRGLATGGKTSSGEREAVAALWAGLGGIFLFGLFFAAIWAFALRIGVVAGFSRTSVGAVLSSNLLVTGVGSSLASAVSLKSGRTLPVLVSYGVLAACAGALAHPVDFWVFAVALIGLGLGVGFCMPFQLGAISSLDEEGRFVSLIAAAQGIGSALGPLIGGVAFDAVGAFGVGVVALIVLALSFVAFLFVLTGKVGRGSVSGQDT